MKLRQILALLLLAAGCSNPAPDAEAANRLAALRRAVAARHATAPLVLDRDGHPLTNDFAPFLGTVAQSGSATMETTLDPFVQRAALDALGSYHGAIVAIDPRTNEILAIASSRGKGPPANLAL